MYVKDILSYIVYNIFYMYIIIIDSRGVPLKSEISDDDWHNFQPDLFWVIRDFYLELINENNEQLTPTEWVMNSFNKVIDTNIIDNMFKSINAFTLPRPTNDVVQLKNLMKYPGLRSPQFKVAVNHLRNSIFDIIRCKTITDNKPMTGKDLINLLRLFIDRLNSDAGISSINTMQMLVNGINNQVIYIFIN